MSLDLTHWITKDRLEKSLENHAGSFAPPSTLNEILFGKSTDIRVPENAVFVPLESFLHTLVLEQLKSPGELLKLNPSRRDSLARFLSELARMPDSTDSIETLKQFTRIDRTQAEHTALKQLFKQIGLVQIAKALLLKSWRFHAKAQFSKSDLKDLTGAVERDLRPFIHLQTSTCQLIQRNFYSWYKMSSLAQDQLWSLLEETSDLESAKLWLLCRASSLSAETLGERERYGPLFYQNLWRAMDKNQIFQSKVAHPIGFSPTLRNGSLMEDSPSSIDWVGFEPLSFELLFCEVRSLWKEPKSPSLWLKGSGLEMSMEHQTSLMLTNSGKQNVLKQMDSISCCEIALIAEETLIRTQGRTLAAQALRKQIEEHSILKKLKQPATTRGIYQACQALEKLRQGGILIWAREELLNEASGKPSLQFILNQAKILMIADLSALACEKDDLRRDLPKVVYLLKKETNLEERKSHRPLMIKAYGTVSHHQDTSLLLDRILALVQKPELVFPREPFQLQARVSPMDQREWEQHWFNPSDDGFVDQIEELKRNSVPLGQLAHIRTLHAPPSHNYQKHESDLFSETRLGSETGFYAWIESSKAGNEIFTALPGKLPAYLKSSHTLYLIAPANPEWGAALQSLVRSNLTRDWFNYSAERKKGAWLVKESDLKSIPVPRHISETLLKWPVDLTELSQAHFRTLHTIGTEPALAVNVVENTPELKPHAFIIASQALCDLENHQGALFSLVSPDEEIHYDKLFQTVLTPNDLCPLHQHPLIRFTSTLSMHQSIQAMSAHKFPTPGILLTTSKGLTQMLYIQDAWLRERCFEMLKSVQKEIAEPTWGEIVDRIRVPKNPDQAQMLANQILKAFGTEKLRKKELKHLLSVCLTSQKLNSEKMGLLQ